MEFNDVIHSRRTIYQFEDTTVSLQEIMPALEMAVLAPNHHLTQPWQFIWLGHHIKVKLAEVYAEMRVRKKRVSDPDQIPMLLEHARARFMGMPAMMMVACKVGMNALENEEDYAATCCAIQNLLLGLHNQGLGAQWSTHPMLHADHVKKMLGLDVENWRLVGLVYIGKPAVIPPAPPRKPVIDFIRILD